MLAPHYRNGSSKCLPTETANRMTYIKWLFKQTKPLHKNRRLWWIGSSKIPTFVAFNKTVWNGCLIGNICYSNFGKMSKNVAGFNFISNRPTYVSVKHSFYSQKPQNLTMHTGWSMYWPGPFNYLQIFLIQGFMVLKQVYSYD